VPPRPSKADDTNTGRPNLTVVVPVYNNAATLAALCDQLKEVLQAEGISFELLFVNDGSRDDSLHRLSELAKQHPEITIVELAGNFGQATALLCGLAEASGDNCVILDADLQDPPSALPLLWRARAPEVSAVFAGRRGRSQSLGRDLTSFLYRTFLNVVTGLPKDASMYVLMDRQLVDAMVSFPTGHPWIPAMIGCLRAPARSVPVQRMIRAEGRSSYTGLARLRVALTGVACVLGYRLRTSDEPYLQRRGKEIVRAVSRARALSEPSHSV